jgi:hypothetical protein
MTGQLQLFIRRLDSVRMRCSAERILQEFISQRPSESELETAHLFYASWLHEHSHHAPHGRAA